MPRELVNYTVIRPGDNFMLEWRKASVVMARQVRAKKKRDG
jgi:hypothetical protein